jgi:hypothetical protein
MQNNSERYVEPKPQTTIGVAHSEYNGRQFYGHNADDNAELHYLRDWKRWAEQQLRGYRAWEASVSEALNSGDGSYRP